MTSLLHRLQSLTGPDREVDAEIGRGLGVEPKRKNIYKRGHYLGGKPVLLRVEEEWPRYTESLDAVEPLLADFYYLLAKGKLRPKEPLYGVQIMAPDSSQKVLAEAEHDIAAIALLIAWAKMMESDSALSGKEE